MLGMSEPTRISAISRTEGLAACQRRDVLCVDSADCASLEMRRFRSLNPFDFCSSVRIPVPGSSRTSCSVEAIWQGLKLVDGEVAPEMFSEHPYKRPSEEARRKIPNYRYAESSFVFRDQILDLVTARMAIYLPSYLHKLHHCTPAAVFQEIAQAFRSQMAILFFDWDSNFDITCAESPFSHSAILSSWFDGTLDQAFLQKATSYLSCHLGHEHEAFSLLDGARDAYLSTYPLYMSATK